MTAQAIRAEWVKFRSVRGWLIGMLVAMLAIIALGVGPGAGSGSCNVSSCTGPLGQGGEQVTDGFYFVHQQLAGNGSITVQVTALTGQIPGGGGPRTGGTQWRPGLVPWAKAGIIIKASTQQGSAYAAMMVTGSHGVRMQYDYTGDLPGLAGSVSAVSPRWLRLTRSGDTVTGYDSADGAHWAKVGTVALTGLPATVPTGMFTTSPDYFRADLGTASIEGGLSQATGVFGHVGLEGGWTGGSWTGTAIGAPQGPAPGPAQGFQQAGGRFTVTGAGDIAPSVAGAAGIGVTVAQTLIGGFAGLIVIVVIGAMFMTAEYRRGLIRLTFSATPRRGRVLAAKATVIAAVSFVAGLAAATVVVTVGQRVLRADGAYVWPVTTFTEVRVIVGTAAVLAVAAVIAVAVGTIVRRSAAAVAAVIVAIVLPYLLTVAVPVLPVAAADWVARLSPAAAFAVQQTVIQYPQVDNLYAPSAGYFPLPAWAGFAVLCGWAVLALGLAGYLLHRRDA